MLAQEISPCAVPPPPVPAASARRRQRRRGGNGEDTAASLNGAGESTRPGRLVEDLAQVEWMICEFKTAPCTIENPTSHDHRCCPYYHSSRDRRRAIHGMAAIIYKGEPCSNQFDDARTCSEGDACTQCHSTAELLYHPEFFRKRLCHQSRRCPRGRYCAFAHNRHELLVPHFGEGEEAEPTEEFITHRFKTQWCPVGGPHDWENCVYAHTYRDWRRVPIVGYSSHPCPRWISSVSNGKSELAYADRCIYGMACPLAHGAKEQLYHPLFYKTSPCSDSNCKRGALCAFTHGEGPRPVPIDDMSSKNGRQPLPGAEEMLKVYQPTYIEPPMYHALEDAPRGGAASSGKAKNRKAKQQQQGQQSQSAPGSINISASTHGPFAQSSSFSAPASASGSATINLASGDASQRVPQMPMPQFCAGAMTGTEPSMMVMPGPFGPCYYQWMPTVDQGMEMGAMQMGNQMQYSPMMANAYSGPTPAFMPVQQPGPAPSPMDSPLRVKQPTDVEAELGTSSSPAVVGLPNLLGMEPGRMAEIYVKDAERDIRAWQRGVGRKFKQMDGCRTPSSWGSPPLSNANTAPCSPREEACAM